MNRPTLWEGLVCAIVATLLMWPVLGAPHQRVFGAPSDPLAEVWRLQQLRDGTLGLVGNGVAETANAPDGLRLRRPVEVTQVFYDVPAAGLARVMPPVLAYNLLVWLGLWTAGLAATWALLRLGVSWVGAVTGGVLFMLAPVQVQEAQLHVALALVAPLAILLALGVALLRAPSRRRGVAVGVTAGLCGYVNPYLPLEVMALLGGLLLAALGTGLAVPPRRRPLARAVGWAAATGALVSAPLAVVLATSRQQIDAAVARPQTDLAQFTLLPDQLLQRGTSGYLGWAVLVAAAAGAVWGRGGRALRVSLVAISLTGVWFSLSPASPVLGRFAVAPAVHSLLPYWRVYGRAEVVALLGLTALAGLAVARVAQRPGWVAGLAAALVAGVLAGDLVQAPPSVAAADLGRPDPVARWLAGARGVVAEIPLRTVDDYRLGPLLFRQTRHGRPILNGAAPGTRSADLTEAVTADGGRQALAAFRVGRVDRVAVTEDAEAPPGLTPGPLLGTVGRGYMVPAGPGAVALARSAYPPDPVGGGAALHWLSAGAVIRVLTSCDGMVIVTGTAGSVTPRVARIGARTVDVSTTPGPFTVRVPVHGGLRDLPVVTDPPPGPLSPTDPRVAGIGVSGLRAVVRCTP